MRSTECVQRETDAFFRECVKRDVSANHSDHDGHPDIDDCVLLDTPSTSRRDTPNAADDDAASDVAGGEVVSIGAEDYSGPPPLTTTTDDNVVNLTDEELPSELTVEEINVAVTAVDQFFHLRLEIADTDFAREWLPFARTKADKRRTLVRCSKRVSDYNYLLMYGCLGARF
jgi:hypothetical protein